MKSSGDCDRDSPTGQRNKTVRLVSFESGLKGDLASRRGLAQEVDVLSALTCDDSAPSTSRLLWTTSTNSSDGFDASSMAAVAETPSVPRILTTLLSIPSNRKCADCRTHMVDSSQTFASFSPSLGLLPKSKGDAANSEIDPALRIGQLLGGHGVFICKGCAKAHGHLGSTITIVKSVNDFPAWSLEQARYLQQCGGNSASWSAYEGFIPDGWKQHMPSSTSPLDQRSLFARAKYDALAFVMPSSVSPVACRAWQTLLTRDRTLQRFVKPGCLLTSLSSISLVDIKGTKGREGSASHDSNMPDRFVDFFCVVGHKKKLYAGENRKDLYAIESPEGLALESTVLDCYPAPHAHTDMEFPEQISQFVFPDGCRASETQKPPALFTFVLTAGNGYRLYCAALRVYDETMETAQMKDVLHASGYTVPMPWWLSDSSVPPRTMDGTPARRPSDIIFLPKCLVVISHYSFFHAYRAFLKQLYQMSILETPLPIERYIANFASELPLPPQGKVEVKFGFMSDMMCTISRPAPNELPLAKFSYLPLFTAMSISNIIVVVGCLMEETKVVLLSQRYGLLTPCAEAFLSFLFPFEWQGIYIPIMPYSLLDVLDAPVPFLVGLHARYLAQVKPEDRPKGVVFVDLDRDTVHLGFKERTDERGRIEKRLPPMLPEKDSMKLRSKLQEFGGNHYILPKNGIKGLITHGNGEYLHNSLREPYAHMETFDPSMTSTDARIRILDESEHAFPESGGSSATAGFVSEEGQLSTKTSVDTAEKVESKSRLFSKLRAKIDRRQASDVIDTSLRTHITSTDLYNVDEVSHLFQNAMSTNIDIRTSLVFATQEACSLNVSEIRNAFLRFFTSIFNGYEKHATKEMKGELFRAEEFLNEKNLSPLKRKWLGLVVETQLFQRFLEERLEDPHDASVLLFDEAIIAKNNRSMKKSIKQGKMTTPFLDNESWKISDSFTPPAPSNWGLPADGRRYSYPKFPRLDQSLFGAVRAKKRWPPEWEQKIQRKGISRVKSMRRNEMLRKAIGSERMEVLMTALGASKGEAVPTLLTKLSQVPADRNLSWALITATQASVKASVEDMDVSSSGNLSGHMLRSSGDSGFLPELSQKPDDVLFANEILLASRRKQSILVLRVIKMQGQARRYIHVSNYKRYAQMLHHQNTDRTIADLPFVLKNVLVIQCFVRCYIAVKRYRRRLSCVLCIQRNYRRSQRLSMQKKINQSTLIQSWWRGILARRLAAKLMRSILSLQAVYRGTTTRFRFALVKSEICKIQAHVRACLVRKQVHDLLELQVSRYRRQIFYLWTRANTPLSYRTQMWSLFTNSFLGSRMSVDELLRMWKFLGLQESGKKVVSKDNVVAALSNMAAMASQFFSLVKAPSVVRQYAKRIEIERLQVYERLNGIEKTSKLLAEIYQLLGISHTEKKKKARAVEKLWCSIEHASASVKAMTLLFPELAGGTDIIQVTPTKKGLKRFSNKQKNPLLDPLEKDLWVDRKLDNLFRKNMSEVAIATLQTMPDLCVKLHTANMRKTASFRRRKQARLSSDQDSRYWQDYKRREIYKFLYS
ncbi:Rab guanyl-nucleotide exchange factor [Fragilaria crotonensis]|nr:Rab guanyl-nucleotide exchange factor [Fragilaria crotonensis]